MVDCELKENQCPLTIRRHTSTRIVLYDVTQYVLKPYIRKQPWFLAELSRCIRLGLIWHTKHGHHCLIRHPFCLGLHEVTSMTSLASAFVPF